MRKAYEHWKRKQKLYLEGQQAAAVQKIQGTVTRQDPGSWRGTAGLGLSMSSGHSVNEKEEQSTLVPVLLLALSLRECCASWHSVLSSLGVKKFLDTPGGVLIVDQMGEARVREDDVYILVHQLCQILLLQWVRPLINDPFVQGFFQSAKSTYGIQWDCPQWSQNFLFELLVVLRLIKAW